jgi:hypothetical protein
VGRGGSDQEYAAVRKIQAPFRRCNDNDGESPLLIAFQELPPDLRAVWIVANEAAGEEQVVMEYGGKKTARGQ